MCCNRVELFKCGSVNVNFLDFTSITIKRYYYSTVGLNAMQCKAMLHNYTINVTQRYTMLHQVIKALSGPPNYWDMDRIENNMFRRYKRKDLDGTLYDAKSIMHYR